MQALVTFMRAKAKGSELEKPTAASDWPDTLEQLAWFATAEASAYERAASAQLKEITAVFGFARLLALGQGFIARNHGGARGAYFVGYERQVMCDPGTVLIDATADIDGVSHLNPFRHAPLEPPRARYDNLTIIYAPLPTREQIKMASRNTPIAACLPISY